MGLGGIRVGYGHIVILTNDQRIKRNQTSSVTHFKKEGFTEQPEVPSILNLVQQL